MTVKNQPSRKNVENLLKPPAINPPANCAVVAPASPMDEHMIISGAQKLKEIGIIPPESVVLPQDHKYLAGSDNKRATAFMEAFKDSDTEVIFCVRGGYGCSRILDSLDFDLISKNPKLFVGYSDITFLHCALWSQCRLVTIHGPTISQLRVLPDNEIRLLAELFTSPSKPEYHFPLAQTIKSGTAVGRVLGGNLTCLCHVLGTQYEPDFADCILVLEDRGEALYRIDRMLNHLKLAGKLDSLRGLVLGEFISCGPVSAIWELVHDVLKGINIPVLAGIPVGHGSRNIPLPLGLEAVLDSDEKTLAYLDSPTDVSG